MAQRVQQMIGLALLLALAAGSAEAAGRVVPVLGTLGGRVRDARGAPQMGAAVAILTGDGRTLLKVYTDDRGAFLAERLLPGLYSLRVTLSSFLPVTKENVLVGAGTRSFLTINLASIFDAVDALAGGNGQREDSDEDWKWIVRSSGATRPVLRWSPGAGDPPVASLHKAEYRARLEFSGGGGRSTAQGSEADFNTGFSMAQGLFANSTLLLSGNLGYERHVPATAFRGTFRRELANGSAPAVSITMRRVFLPAAYFDGSGRTSLQTLSLSFDDSITVGSAVRLEYGMLYDSISFLDRHNILNPYGRLVVQATPVSSFQVIYAAGTPRMRAPGSDPLREAASQLAIYPRLSVRGGLPTLQRGRHMEAAFQHKFPGEGLLQVSAYRDDISNLAISAALDGLEFDSSEFLPDVFARNYSYNGGAYQAQGARVAYQQRLGNNLRGTVAYTFGGMLAPERNVLFSGNSGELRNILRMQNRHALAVKLGADLPVTRTRVLAAYKWILGPVISAGDFYDESLAQAEPNLNIMVRQPLPSFITVLGRVEALADFRNLLAQGYIPITTADGRRLLLVQNMRSFRGGFSVNF